MVVSNNNTETNDSIIDAFPLRIRRGIKKGEENGT